VLRVPLDLDVLSRLLEAHANATCRKWLDGWRVPIKWLILMFRNLEVKKK